MVQQPRHPQEMGMQDGLKGHDAKPKSGSNKKGVCLGGGGGRVGGEFCGVKALPHGGHAGRCRGCGCLYEHSLLESRCLGFLRCLQMQC